MIPLRDENPSGGAPTVTVGLIVLNTAFFLYEVMLGSGVRDLMFEWGLIPARIQLAFWADADVGFRLSSATTLFSSMFLHGGWMHLIGNMWYLWIFGDNIEDQLGKVRYVAFYLASGLVAAILHLATNFDSRIPTVGASGAIAGVLGAYAALFPRARVMTLLPIFPFVQIVALPALVVLGLWFVLQFFSGTLSIGRTGGGIAWWAHVGGFAFGFLAMKVAGGRRESRAWVEP